jgi:DNA-binding MurR/RpiR family transcriptional regulator
MATRNTSGSEGTRNQGGNPGEGAGLAGTSPPTLKQQASDLGRKATEGAREVATQAQSEARNRVERGRQEAATTLSSVASTLLQSGLQLRDDQQTVAGDYVERAARQIERAANYVQNADLREMVDEVEHFARRRPALFVGSAFAAGLLAARFLKSSRTTQSRSEENTQLYMDREVPAPVAREPRGSLSEPETWQEPPL